MQTRPGSGSGKGEAMQTLKAKPMLEHAIEKGRGGVYLKLTPEQDGRLRRLLWVSQFTYATVVCWSLDCTPCNTAYVPPCVCWLRLSHPLHSS